MTDIIQQQWSTLAAHKQAEFYKAGSNLLTKFIKCMPVFITRNIVTLLLVHLLYRLYVTMTFLGRNMRPDFLLLLSFFVCLAHQDGSKKNVHYLQGQTWPSSQNFCRQKHTDLACVHSEEGNVAINTLTYRVWMGLFKDSWVWSDGTKTSFRYWKRSGSYSGNCVTVEGSQTGLWIPADCQGGKF